MNRALEQVRTKGTAPGNPLPFCVVFRQSLPSLQDKACKLCQVRECRQSPNRYVSQPLSLVTPSNLLCSTSAAAAWLAFWYSDRAWSQEKIDPRPRQQRVTEACGSNSQKLDKFCTSSPTRDPKPHSKPERALRHQRPLSCNLLDLLHLQLAATL